MAHRELWEAVLLDRLGLSGRRRPGGLPVSGLIKLRDLSNNIWNADKLFILTPDAASAHRLVAIIDAEDWGDEKPQVFEGDDVDQALGGSEEGQAVVTVWWD